MKKTIRLTENDLHRVIKESVEAYLMEVQGWTLQKGDITWVNSVDAEDEQEYYQRYAGNGDNYAGIKPYLVGLWQGSGYLLMHYGAWAYDEGEALEEVVAYLDKNNQTFLFCDDEVEREMDELRQEGMDDEEIYNQIDGWAYYVDCSMQGGNENHWIRTENLKIKLYNPENVMD